MPSVPFERVIEEIEKAFRRGDMVNAVAMVREIVRQSPQAPQTRLWQARTALAFDQPRDAVALLETLIFELTGEPLREATIDLAHAREVQGDLENALLTLRPELESEDPPIRAIATAARIKFRQGDAAGAIELLDGAAPDDKSAHLIAAARGFIALNTPQDDADLVTRQSVAIDALKAESERVGVPAAPLMDLLIDLGELLARTGDDAAAARAWRRSASLSPAKADPRVYAQSVGALMKSWAGKNLDRARAADTGEGATTERPIFVVGMPGGSTSFVADLLAAADGVERAQDREALTAAVGAYLAPKQAQSQPVVPDPSRLGGKQLADAGTLYLARTAPTDESSTRVVDAFELNIHTIGIVAQVFPKAAVVFVTRDPFDACLSCMLAHRDPRLLHANDAQGLAVFASGIARLSSHWADIFAGNALPLKHTTVTHESLLSDAAARSSLFDALGLKAPDAEKLKAIADSHARSTATASGLKDRFASSLQQLAEATAQISPAAG